jgi:hypothetical protein
MLTDVIACGAVNYFRTLSTIGWEAQDEILKLLP